MKVTFVFRSPGTGHSLETVFKGVSDELNRGQRVRAERIILPHISQGLRTIGQNLNFVREQGLKFSHITGDVHYVALATGARKTVLTVADCVLLNRTNRKSLRFFVFWLLWYYLPIRKAAIVTAISEKTKQELYQYVGRLANKVVVVPCHYDPVFTYQPKPFPTDKPTLLHIGTAPHKNLSRLIEALEGMSCRLLIVGKLTDAETENLTTRRIDYQSYVNISQAQIVSLYEQCDLVTFVSLYEGFGMPVLEAQAVGRPVVTSNRSPMTEVGGTGACYVDPTDVNAIRAGILRVCQDEEYRSGLIQAGLENARQYTIEHVAAQYAGLYAQLRD